MIGEGSWIGCNVVVMVDVGCDFIVVVGVVVMKVIFF